MEIKQLEIFVAVVRHKSFSKAAEALFLSQSAVTGNVQKLERELGAVLIDRLRRRIELTAIGEIFYPYAVEILNLCMRSMTAIGDHRLRGEGQIEICASSIPGQYLLPYLIRDFKREYPDVVFSVRHMDSRDVVDEVHAGKINFGLVGARWAYDSVSYTDLYEDRMVMIASPNRGMGDRALGIRDLAGLDLVLREDGSGTRLAIENALKARAVDLRLFRSVTISDNLETIKQMVALDLGVSFVSEIAVRREVGDGRLRAYDVADLDLRRCFSIVCGENRVLSPVEEEFKRFASSWRFDGY